MLSDSNDRTFPASPSLQCAPAAFPPGTLPAALTTEIQKNHSKKELALLSLQKLLCAAQWVWHSNVCHLRLGMGAGQQGVQGQPGPQETCLKTQKQKQQKEIISDLGVVTHTYNFWVTGRRIATSLRPSCWTQQISGWPGLHS